MIHKLLRKLHAQHKSKTLISPLSDTCHVARKKIAAARLIGALDVPEGEYAVTYQATSGTKLYASGTHTIKAEDVAAQEALDVIYLRTDSLCDGTWSLNYRDHEQAALALSGAYSLLVDNAQKLAQACISAAHFNHDRDFGLWLADSIAHILKTQRIPARDINSENERFAVFLRDALTLSLRPRGLVLKRLSLDIAPRHGSDTGSTETEVVAAQPAAAQPAAAKPTAADAPPAERDPATDTVTHLVIARAERPEKIYYCVRNGKQLGPYAHDEIQQKITAGDLRRRDLLWQKGLSSWQNADQFADFDWPER